MNWLAHLYLSEPNPAFRLGNLLPDLLSRELLANLPVEYQGGIEQHKRIDAFTDAHPVFRRSVQRIEPPYRRFGGILCDLFYDHFLACDWSAYSSQPLATFAGEIYDSFEQLRPHVPTELYIRLNQMRADDWLNSYQKVAGIEHAVQRIGFRLRRPVDLGPSIAIFERDYDLFHEDFNAFFPDLRRHVAERST